MASAPPPLHVTLAGGALTADSPIVVGAAQPLVVNTPFLPWVPLPAVAGAPARVSLKLFQAVRTFISACSVNAAAADIAAAKLVSILRFRLTGAAWTRILGELVASGYAAAPLRSLRDSDKQLSGLTAANPNNLHLVAADWAAGDAFAIPGGSGDAAAARRAVLTPMAYLNIVDCVLLQRTGVLPFKRVADLAGYLGACQTQASRYDAVGTPSATAAALSTVCGAAAVPDGLRARAVARALDRLLLPSTIRSITLDESELAAELPDGIEYHSTTAGARNFLESRILYLEPREYREARGAGCCDQGGGHRHILVHQPPQAAGNSP